MKNIMIASLCAVMLSTSCAQKTKIVAHRGAWKNTQVPQNSIASLQEAIKGKYWGSEFDVCLTKDDVLVVNHDNDFKGVDIATTNYEDLLKQELSNGEKLPTAREYMLEGIKQKKTKMVFEIKPSKLGIERSVRAAELSYQLVKELNALKNTVFISFSYEACLRLRELDKDVKIQYLRGDKTPEALLQDGISELDYSLNVYKKNPSYIPDAQSRNMKINVWTVNKEEDIQYFIDQKVNFITTDEPELATKMLKK